jgi:hypothetical protein
MGAAPGKCLAEGGRVVLWGLRAGATTAGRPRAAGLRNVRTPRRWSGKRNSSCPTACRTPRLLGRAPWQVVAGVLADANAISPATGGAVAHEAPQPRHIPGTRISLEGTWPTLPRHRRAHTTAIKHGDHNEAGVKQRNRHNNQNNHSCASSMLGQQIMITAHNGGDARVHVLGRWAHSVSTRGRGVPVCRPVARSGSTAARRSPRS